MYEQKKKNIATLELKHCYFKERKKYLSMLSR